MIWKIGLAIAVAILWMADFDGLGWAIALAVAGIAWAIHFFTMTSLETGYDGDGPGGPTRIN